MTALKERASILVVANVASVKLINQHLLLLHEN